MKHPSSHPIHSVLKSALFGSLILSGCSDRTDRRAPPTGGTAAAGRSAAVAPAEPVPTTTQFSALTNQFAQLQQAQAEVIQRLQVQVAQLEQHAAEQARQSQTNRESQAGLFSGQVVREQQLQSKLTELEGKLRSLETARVLPEITVAAEDGPTLRELDQKLKLVEQKHEAATESANAAAEARSQNAPRISLNQNGFAFSSADTNFLIRLRGILQLDSRTFLHDNPLSQGNDGFTLRRVRPIIEGTLFRDLDFQFIPEFGGSSGPTIQDAFLNYRLASGLQFRAGKFKGPVGLEQLQADASLPFNERSMVSDLVPLRNVGVQLGGDLANETLSYAVGVFNVAGDARNPGNTDFGDNREFAGRLFARPFKNTGLTFLQGLGFGIGGSYSQVRSNSLALPSTTGGTLPGFATPGLQQFFAYDPVIGTVVADGAQWRLSPQATYTYGPFGLLGEYAISAQSVGNNSTLRSAHLQHSAWQVAGQWVLTGEPASFAGITPRRPFDLHGEGWGAWQLVGRYGHLDVDDRTFPSFANPTISATSATSWSVGVNWWLNKNVRVLLNFTHSTFEGGGLPASITVPASLTAPALVTTQDENLVSTRVQLSF